MVQIVVCSVVLIANIAQVMAQGQCARKPPCAAHQVEDVAGCCVSSPGYQANDAKRVRWSARQQAHHLTVVGSVEPEQEDGGESSLSERGERAWRELVGVELELIKRAQPCQRLLRQGEVDTCLEGLEPLHQQREAVLTRGLERWEQMATEAPDQASRDQGAYYAAIGLFATRQDKEAVKHLKALSKRAQETPYGAWAVASMADFFYGEGAYAIARPMYLRVGTMQAPGLTAYAGLMSAWCAASTGQAQEAFRELLDVPRQLKNRGIDRQVNGELLWREVFKDLAVMYAYVGAPAQAPALMEQLKVEPEASAAWLLRLGQEYGRLGSWSQARQVYKQLQTRQELKPQERAMILAQAAMASQRHGGYDPSWSEDAKRWMEAMQAWDKATPQRDELAQRQWSELSTLAAEQLRACIDADYKPCYEVLTRYRALGAAGADELYFACARSAEVAKDLELARKIYRELAKDNSVWQPSAKRALERLR